MRTNIQTTMRPLATRARTALWSRIPMVILIVLLLSGQAYALWMPWATEPDKIKKCIDDVWKAFLSGNRGLLEENLVTGPSSQTFIAQELDFIRKMGVVDFYFRFRNIKVDQVKNEWAWVTLDKIARLRNGAKMNTSTVMVFKKVDGFWKLYTNPKTMRERRKDGVVRKNIQWQAGVNRAPSVSATPKSNNNGFQWVKGPVTGSPREDIKDRSSQSKGNDGTDKTAIVQNGWTVKKNDKSGANTSNTSNTWTAEAIPKAEPKQTNYAAQNKPPKAIINWVNPKDSKNKTHNKPIVSTTDPKRQAPDPESTSNGWTIKKGPEPTLMDVIKNHGKLR